MCVRDSVIYIWYACICTQMYSSIYQYIHTYLHTHTYAPWHVCWPQAWHTCNSHVSMCTYVHTGLSIYRYTNTTHPPPPPYVSVTCSLKYMWYMYLCIYRYICTCRYMHIYKQIQRSWICVRDMYCACVARLISMHALHMWIDLLWVCVCVPFCSFMHFWDARTRVCVCVCVYMHTLVSVFV